MRLTTAIIDNSNINTDKLKKILVEQCYDALDVIFTSTNYNDAKEKINTLKPKLIFLDIELDKASAFDLLKEIDPYNYILVFTSNTKKYAFQVFKYNTAYYILKPFSSKKVNLAVNLAWRQYHSQNFSSSEQIEGIINTISKNRPFISLAIPEVNFINLVNYDNILFCKSDGRYTEIHTIGGKVEISAKNLGKYEEILPSDTFYRIHKSYIVNLNKIDIIGNINGAYCKLYNNVILPISKRKTPDFLKTISI